MGVRFDDLGPDERSRLALLVGRMLEAADTRKAFAPAEREELTFLLDRLGVSVPPAPRGDDHSEAIRPRGPWDKLGAALAIISILLFFTVVPGVVVGYAAGSVAIGALAALSGTVGAYFTAGALMGKISYGTSIIMVLLLVLVWGLAIGYYSL